MQVAFAIARKEFPDQPELISRTVEALWYLCKQCWTYLPKDRMTVQEATRYLSDISLVACLPSEAAHCDSRPYHLSHKHSRLHDTEESDKYCIVSRPGSPRGIRAYKPETQIREPSHVQLLQQSQFQMLKPQNDGHHKPFSSGVSSKTNQSARASHPPPEENNERLETFFGHDLDEPLIDSAGFSAAEVKPATSGFHTSSANSDKKSRPSSDMSSIRRMSEKLAGSKLEEVATSQRPSVTSVSKSPTIQFPKGELLIVFS